MNRVQYRRDTELRGYGIRYTIFQTRLPMFFRLQPANLNIVNYFCNFLLSEINDRLLVMSIEELLLS